MEEDLKAAQVAVIEKFEQAGQEIKKALELLLEKGGLQDIHRFEDFLNETVEDGMLVDLILEQVGEDLIEKLQAKVEAK